MFLFWVIQLRIETESFEGLRVYGQVYQWRHSLAYYWRVDEAATFD